MFGTNKGFDRLTQELATLGNDTLKKSAFVIFGEFGRQLKSNGDNGTDHGRGNSIIIISQSIAATPIDSTSVAGCFYGDPFPADELSRLETINTDIVGKTSSNRVFAELLNWQQDGLGNIVFDSLVTSPLESGVDLSGLFSIT